MCVVLITITVVLDALFVGLTRHFYHHDLRVYQTLTSTLFMSEASRVLVTIFFAPAWEEVARRWVPLFHETQPFFEAYLYYAIHRLIGPVPWQPVVFLILFKIWLFNVFIPKDFEWAVKKHFAWNLVVTVIAGILLPVLYEVLYHNSFFPQPGTTLPAGNTLDHFIVNNSLILLQFRNVSHFISQPFAGSVGTKIVIALLFAGPIREMMSWALTHLGGVGRLKTNVLRQAVRRVPRVRTRQQDGHTHPVAAGERTAARNWARDVAKYVGLTYYSYQKSPTECYQGVPGSSQVYDVVDLKGLSDATRPDHTHYIHMTDVDGHIDMNQFLIDHEQPVDLYTYMFNDLAGSQGDTTWTFTKEGELLSFVAGGAKYQHKVWDYARDNTNVFGVSLNASYSARLENYLLYICVIAMWHTVVPTCVSIYSLGLLTILLPTRWFPCFIYDVRAVESRSWGNNRASVVLVPISRYHGVLAFIAKALLEPNELKRFDPRCSEDFMATLVTDVDQTYFSVGKLGVYASTRVPVECMAQLEAYAANSSNKPTAPSVTAGMKGFGIDQDRVHYNLLTSYLRSGNVVKARQDASNTSEVRKYCVDPFAYDEGTPCMRQVMPPLYDAKAVPVKCYANDQYSIHSRVELVRDGTFMTNTLKNYAEEFANCFAPEHLLEPVEYDDVWDKQSRPTQRRIISEYLDAPADPIPECTPVRAFMKAEAGDVKAPRNISTLPSDTKVEWSRYMYALAAHLKEQKWYAFGKTPKAVAEKVAEIMQASDHHAYMGDFSRMDGRVSPAVRDIEKIVMETWFSEEYHEAIREWASRNFNLQARTANGVSYETGTSRLSGSPETSAFNSIVTGLVMYISFRLQGYEVLEAATLMNTKVIVGGDDSAAADVDPDTATKAAQMVGQKLVGGTIPRGNPGVNFLSRYYGPDVFRGDPNSCSAPARHLGKLHFARKSALTSDEALRSTLLSYYLTDGNSPVFEELTRNPDIMQPPSDNATTTARWWSRFNKEVQFPNEKADWMRDLYEKEIPTIDWEAVEKLKTINFAQLRETNCQIARRVDEFPPADQPIVIDGQVQPDKEGSDVPKRAEKLRDDRKRARKEDREQKEKQSPVLLVKKSDEKSGKNSRKPKKNTQPQPNKRNQRRAATHRKVPTCHDN